MRDLSHIRGHFNFAGHYDDVLRRLISQRTDFSRPIRIMEIGVFCGRSTCYLADKVHELSLRHPIEFHCCAAFNVQEPYTFPGLSDGDDFSIVAIGHIREQGLQDFVTVHVGNSHDVLSQFPDEYFDFVFVDGCHERSVVRGDIELGRKKLAVNGILSGHDYGLPDVQMALNDVQARFIHDSRCDVWEIVAYDLPNASSRLESTERGICYVAWGSRHVAEAAMSADTTSYPTCLFTTPDTIVPYGRFSRVLRATFAEYEDVHHFYKKLAVLRDSPFETTMYCDGDITMQGDISLGFARAERYGFAIVVAPGMSFRCEEGEYVHYNCGALWFRGRPQLFADAVLQFAKRFDQTDEPAWSLAFEELGINPVVLPGTFNLVIAGRIHDRQIRALHTRGPRKTHIVSHMENQFAAGDYVADLS